MILVEARPEHIVSFSKTVSAENVRELREFYGLDPTEAILNLVDDDSVYAVVYNDKVVCLTSINDDGLMWALFSADINDNSIRFVRASRALIEYYHRAHDQIECRVWTENGKALQWLTYIGFEPVGVSRYGDHHDYVTFVRCNPDAMRNRAELLRPVIH